MANDASSPWVAAPGEALCLDFANTRFWRGIEPSTETLYGIDDLVGWCVANEALPTERAERWKGAPDAAAVFADALDLREAIYRVFVRMASKASPESRDLETINRALAETPPRRALAPLPSGFGWDVPPAPGAVGLLTPVLWSAGDLLTGRRLAKLKHCANDRCLWLFLDDSKSGNRRWCTMASCGNRAKAHRHYVKRRRASH
jgi:predicted RNA-binding Zn ribbon-like protein